MAVCDVNDIDVVEGQISLPRVGAWHADLVVRSEDALAGACTISTTAGLTLKGTVVRAGVYLNTSWARIVGGAGGTSNPATAKHYRGVTLRAIVNDLLRVSGDKLAGTSDQAMLTTRFQAWTLPALSVGRSLTALCSDPRTATAAWRLLPDGSLWIGREKWPDAGLTEPDDYQDSDERPSEGWADLGFEAPLLQPGVALGGRKLDTIEHAVTEEAVRTRVWFAS